MNKHPHFVIKTANFGEGKENFDFIEGAMTKYPNGELRLVGYNLQKGMIVYMGLDRENRPLYKAISDIKEENPSKGEFNNHIRPTSYRVVVS